VGWPFCPLAECLEKCHVLCKRPIPCLKAAITQKDLRMNRQYYGIGTQVPYSKPLSISIR
jgi:hypothetical protein